MSELNDIITVVISRETQSIAIASFGTEAIISEFLTSKTSPAFDRNRDYASLEEMVTDGWSSTDDEYKAAAIAFSQNPKVDKVMIGRLNDVGGVGDATIADGLSAIQIATADWYAWMIIPPGVYATDVKAAAAWNETQKKIFFNSSFDVNILDGSDETDLAFFFKNLAYDRTVTMYHPDSQDGNVSGGPAWMESGWPGETLPFDPGSQTWAYKTIAGVASYGLTSAQRTAALGKNCNVYTATAGVNITEEGKVASGEYIDIIRGLDWLESTLQTNVFANLVNKRKIPFTDEGAATVETAVKSALSEGVENTLIAPGFIVTVPKISTVSAANKLARNLPDVKFSAILQGAIHSVEIAGTVTV